MDDSSSLRSRREGVYGSDTMDCRNALLHHVAREAQRAGGAAAASRLAGHSRPLSRISTAPSERLDNPDPQRLFRCRSDYELRIMNRADPDWLSPAKAIGKELMAKRAV